MNKKSAGFDFIGKAKLFYTISLIVVSIGIIFMIVNMFRYGFPLRRGIDFTGGSIIELRFDNWDKSKDANSFANEVVGFIKAYSNHEPSVQTSLTDETGATSLTLSIRGDASLIDNKTAQTELYDKIRASGGEFTVLEENQVGALMGKELTSKALWGVLLGNFLILLYLTWRLSLDFALFAVVGLIHDILVICTVFAIANFEINSNFVAVLLTVVGYSINDTIIIYDRIRENMTVKRHLPFNTLVNVSLNETWTRSVNTTVTAVLAVLALLIFGGESIKTFMVGLAVGFSTGAYSSIFICAQLLVGWRMRNKGVAYAEVPSTRAASTSQKIVSKEVVEDHDRDIIDGEEEEVEMIKVGTSEAKGDAGKARPKRRRRR
jgi:preprotein translocase subunit SecF